jgi:hypothetical protein
MAISQSLFPLRIMTSLSPVARVTKIVALTLGATAALACSDSTGSLGPRGLVQFINAAPLQPAVDLHVGAVTSVNNLPFGQVSELEVHASDTAQIFSVYDSTSTTQLESTQFVVADGGTYRLVLMQGASVGTATDLLYFPDTVSAPSSGHAKISVVNTSPEEPLLDLYVLANGSGTADLDTATKLATIGYGVTYPYTEITGGSHDLVLTRAGTKTPLVDLQNLNLAAGTAVTFITINKVGGGISAVYWGDR